MDSIKPDHHRVDGVNNAMGTFNAKQKHNIIPAALFLGDASTGKTPTIP